MIAARSIFVIVVVLFDVEEREGKGVGNETGSSRWLPWRPALESMSSDVMTKGID